MNPFPPNSNAYINYEFGMGFPPLDFAPNLWNDFKKKFYKLYNYEPIRLSSLAHDSLTTVFSIIDKNEKIYELNYDDFQNSYGFTGIDGEFKFLSNGTVQRKLSILEVKQNSFKVEKLAKKKKF